jgi:hypothetical protein
LVGFEPAKPYFDPTHDEAGCFDHIFLQIIKDRLAGRRPDVWSVGISYLYVGKWLPNESHATGSGDEFHVGPRIMIIGLEQQMLQTFSQDGSNGRLCASHLPGRTEL